MDFFDLLTMVGGLALVPVRNGCYGRRSCKDFRW